MRNWFDVYTPDGALERALGGTYTLLLCDKCYEQETGDIAVCQDGCNLSLDHVGLCDSPNPTVHCQRCGDADRLHETVVGE